jgi:LemA protein
MDSPFVVGLAIALFLVLVFVIGNYNRLVRVRQHVRDSFAGIDVELKRRYELVPNLVATVRGYATHERALLERLVELRNRAAGNHGSPDSQSRDENAMLRELRSVFVLAEGYPALRSDRQFLALQRELATTEDRIAAARRYYNGNVRELRQLCEMFPSSLIAKWFGFTAPEYFDLDDALERIVPRVDV